jgi:prephenate dehydrogenase
MKKSEKKPAKRTWNTVAIVGVGMIGGSIGLALRKRKLAKSVIGIGRSRASLLKAKKCGAVDTTTTDLARGVHSAELTIVCTPVEQIAGHIREVAAACPKDALITDAGSTKRAIVEAVNGTLPEGVRFIGSHPLAGSEKTGPENARADLFTDRVVVITPVKGNTVTDAKTIAGFWKSLGARVLGMSPAVHDLAVAATSHVPHVIASALAASTDQEDLALVAGGWLDTTRIAAGDPELWRQILLDNRENTLKALAHFQRTLDELRAAIEQQNGVRLNELLLQGKQRRDAALT